MLIVTNSDNLYLEIICQNIEFLNRFMSFLFVVIQKRKDNYPSYSLPLFTVSSGVSSLLSVEGMVYYCCFGRLLVLLGKSFPF